LSQFIEDYALIGDCETTALVGRNGSIDWLCWPRFDSDACFASLLGDERHGRWLIAPTGAVTSTSRRYLGDTLILETRFETEAGAVSLIDFMPPRGKASDVVRIVRGERGRVAMQMQLVLRFGFGADIPWVKRIDHSLLGIRGPHMAVLRTPVPTHGENMTTVATFEVGAGDEIPFVLTYQESHLSLPDAIDARHALRDTEEFWKQWSARCTYQGPCRNIVIRSLITLKALTYAPTGGIVAAPTTSLPETLGGRKNWDYRYCWLRDATFTLLVLMNAGYTEEALAWHHWLLRAVAGAPNRLQIMYSITGEARLLEWEADWLPGYEGASPVRVGNAAHGQLQLDVYGELIDSFHQGRHAKLEFDDSTWSVECVILEHLATIWCEPDSGIWERRGAPQHYVFSKVMTWVAFDRGIKSAEKFGLPAPLDKWRMLRAQIHADVCARGYDPERNCFTEYYGSKTLDAAVLLLSAVGFLPPDDPRIVGTVAAIESHMLSNGLVMRHDPDELKSGEPTEGAFLACSLWLADAYLLAGEVGKAQDLFDRVVALANDVGLLAEQFDTNAQRQVGNFPQALTHIALVNTAQNLACVFKDQQQKRAG
jgi:GH15 family glucan-1,4-alpha-glucosidase